MAPTHALYLTPHFIGDEASHLFVRLVLEAPCARAGDVLYRFETFFGNVPAHTYEPAAIRASDGAGPLPITIVPPPPPLPGGVSGSGSGSHGEEQWRAGRDTQGDVAVALEVRPRAVDASTPIGARVDLRRDGGGLVGSGRWFLPRPWHPDRRRYRFVVAWDLTAAPPGTRGVWSGGGDAALTLPGPAPLEVEGPDDVFFNAVFMVGPVQSWPPPATSAAAAASPCTTYWFGELPGYLDAVKSFSAAMFPHMAVFFRAPESTFRVFIRKSVRGFGGSSFRASYVLEYDDDAEPWSDCRLVNLLAHEMVHSWAFLGDEDDGFQNLWYIEGIAHYYALYLPVRAGLRGSEYFRETLDAFLCSYYTNPRINIPLRQAQAEFFADFYAESIPYMRGFVYLLLMDGLTRKRLDEPSKDPTPMGNIVLDLMLRQRQGEKIQARHWLEALYPLVGKARADKEFSGMMAGETIDLTPLMFSISLHGVQLWLLPTQQEVMDLGMDASSLRTGIVAGLQAGSRAEEAGLRNGDKLVKHSRMGEALSRFDMHFNYVAERYWEQFQGSYWPRTFRRVPSFQLAERSLGPSSV